MVSVVDRKRNIVSSVIFGLVLLGISVVLCAFFSYFTTPLSNVASGFDDAFYRMVGQGMTKGYLPSGNNYMRYYMLTIPLIPLCEIPIAEGLSKSTVDKRAGYLFHC